IAVGELGDQHDLVCYALDPRGRFPATSGSGPLAPSGLGLGLRLFLGHGGRGGPPAGSCRGGLSDGLGGGLEARLGNGLWERLDQDRANVRLEDLHRIALILRALGGGAPSRPGSPSTPSSARATAG